MVASGLGILLTTVFSDEQTASLGWWIAILAGAPLDFCWLYIQLRMTEPLAFEASTEAASTDVVVRPSVWRILWTEKRAVLHISALSISGAVAFYTWFISACPTLWPCTGRTPSTP